MGLEQVLQVIEASKVGTTTVWVGPYLTPPGTPCMVPFSSSRLAPWGKGLGRKQHAAPVSMITMTSAAGHRGLQGPSLCNLDPHWHCLTMANLTPSHTQNIYDIDCRLIDAAICTDMAAGFAHWQSLL